MRIAIIGAGFAGLAVTWYLLHYTQGSATIDLYDPLPIGGGASGLSSGLFHPYTGRHAKRAWEADECLQQTHRLITEAARAINKPVIMSKGVLRPALTEEQIRDFRACAEKHSDTEWWEKEKCESHVPGLFIPEGGGGGLFIKDGLTIDVQDYLQGLWTACARLGTQFHQQTMIQREEWEKYDRFLIAMGPMSKNHPLLQKLPINTIKGQSLILKWPNHVKPLPFSLNSKKYLVMGRDLKTCIAGSTFERDFDSPDADPALAAREILPDITSYFPSLNNAEILHCHSGFRASSPNHLPLIGQIAEKIYFFTALGSKGLLYHAYVGRSVARTILTENVKFLIPDLHYKLPMQS